MSLWRDKLVVTTVDFLGDDYTGVSVLALNWNQMITGAAVVDYISFSLLYSVQYNRIESGLLAADVDGFNQPDEFAPIPLFGNTDNVYPGFGGGPGKDAISVWELSVDWSNMNAASLDFVKLLATSAFDSVLPCGGADGRECIPQPGTTQKLDLNPGTTARMMNRVAYRRFVPEPSFGACMSSSLSWRECLNGWRREPNKRFEDTYEVQATQTGYESMVMNSGVAAFPTVAGVR
jgi:hypothetical protein